MEEKIGALVLVLLIFSLAVSLLPVRIRYHKETPSLSIPGTYERKILSQAVLAVDFGQIVVIRDPSTDTAYVKVSGTPVRADGFIETSFGRIVLHAPKDWKGSLDANVRFGSVQLRDPDLSQATISVNTGEVEGRLRCSGDLRVNVERGSVKLYVEVPKGYKVHIKLDSFDGIVYYDGKMFKGTHIDKVVGVGEKALTINISASSIELDVRTWRE